MVDESITVYRVKPSKEDVYPNSLLYMLFIDGEPLIGGDSVPVVVEPLVTGELSERNSHLKPSAEEAPMGDLQEVNLDNFLPESRVESLVSSMGFTHQTGCGNVIFDKKTVAKNMVEETVTGTVLVVLGGLTGYKYAADAISYISSASNLQEETIVEWSDNISMEDGKAVCDCGKEVRIKEFLST